MLAFASEASVTPTTDREPAFLRTPTPHDGHLSITAVAEQAPSEPARGWRVTTILVVAGVLTGFAGGYVFADRIITPAVTPAHRVTAPVSAPVSAPAPTATATAATAPTVAAVPSSKSAESTTEHSTEPARESGVVQATQAANASAASEPAAPSSTRRASIPSSTTRPSTPKAQPSTTKRPQAAIAPTTATSGAIEIMSRPRDAQVFLDGVLVGRAPMSIPDVAEGMHEVRVELEGFTPWVGSVRVKGGSRARVGASLEQ